MFLRTCEQLQSTEACQEYWDGTMRNIDLLSDVDGLGFSVHDVRAVKGLEEELWYKHHWEANYIIEGEATLTNLADGESWQLAPGAIYMVGPTDHHRISVAADLHAVSIFNPPLAIGADYDENGTVAPSGPIPPGQKGMFLKSVQSLREQGREIHTAGGAVKSIRALLHEDKLGFTLCDVNLAAGNEADLWYKHHWEANYILEGNGILTDLETNEHQILSPGTLYVVGPEDRHRVRAETDLHLLCVFNPPLYGDELHDSEGTLPQSGSLPPGPVN